MRREEKRRKKAPIEHAQRGREFQKTDASEAKRGLISAQDLFLPGLFATIGAAHMSGSAHVHR